MRRMVALVGWLAFVAAAPLAAQVQSRPTDTPPVTAAGEAWFVNRVPITVGGDTYFPAGAAVFFDGNTMVRTGSLAGVPLYVDTTVEPFSIVLVPAGRGLMQPYERRRDGGLAGTTGSRTPSFPAQARTPDGMQMQMSASAPVGWLNPEAIAPEVPLVLAPTDVDVSSQAVGTAGVATRTVPGETRTALRPQSNDGVWIFFDAKKWVSDGHAVAPVEGNFRRVGDYAGLPVFSRQDGPRDVIFVPSRDGLLAPYRLKP